MIIGLGWKPSHRDRGHTVTLVRMDWRNPHDDSEEEINAKVIMIKLMMMMEVMEVMKEEGERGLLEGGSVLIASLPISFPFGASIRRQDEASSLVKTREFMCFRV